MAAFWKRKRFREDAIFAILKEIQLTLDDIKALADQEQQDIASLKAITLAVADKVGAIAQRFNDFIATLTSGTPSSAQITAIASELATNHNDLSALATALSGIGTTADAEQPPAAPAPTPVPPASPTDATPSTTTTSADSSSTQPSAADSPTPPDASTGTSAGS